MKKVFLKNVIENLVKLHQNLYLAERTSDRRSRGKNIREARCAISDYAQSLPGEILSYIDTYVGVNALSYQWCTTDLGRSIEVLQEWEMSLSNEEL